MHQHCTTCFIHIAVKSAGICIQSRRLYMALDLGYINKCV